MPRVSLAIIFCVLWRCERLFARRAVGAVADGRRALDRAIPGVGVGSPDSSAEAPGRPWWHATTAEAQQGHGALRSARLRVERAFRLPPSLLRPVLDFVPLRSYFVAAADLGDTEISVWEVIVSPGLLFGRAHAVFLRRLFPALGSGRVGVESLWFAPNSALLGVASGAGYAEFWDVRTGEQVVQIDDGAVVGVSPRGDVAVGMAFLDNTIKLALWEMPAGVDGPHVIDAASAAIDVQGVCSNTAFAAEGDTVAAILAHVGDRDDDFLWSVYILNSTSRELLCSREVVRFPAAADDDDDEFRRREAWARLEFRLFAWDGERLLVRHMYSEELLFYQLRPSEGGYELVHTPLRARRVDDAILSNGLILQAGLIDARVLRLLDGPGVEAMFASERLGGDPSRTSGKFSPDGKKALLSHAGRHSLWDFANGPALETLTMDSPVFSPDSVALVGGLLGQASRLALVVRDLDGSQDLYLKDGFDPNGFAVSGLAGWC